MELLLKIAVKAERTDQAFKQLYPRVFEYGKILCGLVEDETKHVEARVGLRSRLKPLYTSVRRLLP